jgi:hypothetical protein
MAGRADLDLYNLLLGIGWVRERVELLKATADPRFLLRARRALLPLPVIDRRTPIDPNVFPPFRHRPIPSLSAQRIAIIAGGGAGACVSLIGVRRAFEEAGVEPEMISACSGGTIWGAMWAAGMDAQEMAEFSLGGAWRTTWTSSGRSCPGSGSRRCGASPGWPRARRSSGRSTSGSERSPSASSRSR